jgi:Zn-dependent membrane protease YugP
MSKWQKVYTDTQMHRAEIVRSILEENGLNAVMVNKKDAAYLIGHYEVYVLPDDVLKAIKIIKDDIQFK